MGEAGVAPRYPSTGLALVAERRLGGYRCETAFRCRCRCRCRCRYRGRFARDDGKATHASALRRLGTALASIRDRVRGSSAYRCWTSPRRRCASPTRTRFARAIQSCATASPWPA
jgi:hypothetical protein